LTTKELLDVIVLSIPTNTGSDAKTIAQSILNMAIIKVGRMKNVSFNERIARFSLVAGQSEYEIGRDIFNGLSVQNVKDMWRTDTTGSPIDILSNDKFHEYAKGQTRTGVPVVASIINRGGANYLALAPIPDSAYPVEATVKMTLSKIEDIPIQYHDVLFPVAVSLVNSIKDPRIALELSRQGLKDIQDHTMVGWSGTVIQAERNMGDISNRRTSDSGNLRGY
jgi:hypothetical protein